ncbi:hypothetical protein LUZ63_004222 [Rhynchospora breviuscula]|uniref:RING-type E3 ubiquitin transferase n=1 Tax=Rhynchospora breviuscula TaxID=2022672 RepID=A0A9Q0I170_9POAL|nr:hypothetical protein LUZ63_004222 [Rhynchospora breviuscula]
MSTTSPVADQHVKTCCNFAATSQIIAIAICAFVILYAIISSLRCFLGRRMETDNMLSPPEPPGLNPTLVAALPMYRYTHQGRGDVPEPECAICLSEVNEGEEVKLLPVCMHLFHKDCIELWLEKKRTCPVCRTGVIQSPGQDQEMQ